MRPVKDSAVQRLTWEGLKDICTEGSRSQGVLEELCVAGRDRELAFWESYRLRENEKKRTALDRVWKAVRSQAVTSARTHALCEAVKADLRELVQEVDDQPDPSVVIANLWSPEDIIQAVLRERFAAQMVEIMEALLIDQYA